MDYPGTLYSVFVPYVRACFLKATKSIRIMDADGLLTSKWLLLHEVAGRILVEDVCFNKVDEKRNL